YICKRYFTIQEFCDCIFVRCIHHCRHCAACAECIIGKLEHFKTLEVHRTEIELCHGIQVHRIGCRQPVRMTEGELYRCLHVRCAHLCHNAVVIEFHHGMDDALPVEYRCHLVHISIEKPFRLYNFQTFIHHCGGIDCNFLSHRPVRVIECHSKRDPGKFLPCEISEGSTACCQYDAFHLTQPFAAQTLENGGM